MWIATQKVAQDSQAAIDAANRNAASAAAQVELAQKQFIATHRPRLRVRYVTITSSTLPVNDKISASIKISNIGESTAIILKIGFDIFTQISPLESGIAFATVYAEPKLIRPMELPPGSTIDIPVKSYGILNQSEITFIISKNIPLLAFGQINYSDGVNIIRNTNFIRKYDININRFRKLDDNDLDADREYED